MSGPPTKKNQVKSFKRVIYHRKNTKIVFSFGLLSSQGCIYLKTDTKVPSFIRLSKKTGRWLLSLKIYTPEFLPDYSSGASGNILLGMLGWR